MSLIKKIRRLLSLGSELDRMKADSNSNSQKILELTGNLLGKINNSVQRENFIDNVEFKVFSQWGDDGIIQYLINHLDICNRVFIEFGVENYTESNTRFLLVNNNWSGLVIDGSASNVEYIKKDPIFWRHDLAAVHSFVTRENINGIIGAAGYSGEIGLLHIDIDGNDYWIWKSIDVVSPVIAIIEYNSQFGPDRAITVPYDPGFQRLKAHHSGIYAGASLLSLCDLAEEKGYCFVGSNSAGNNAYFVRKDKLADFRVRSAQEGYRRSKFREHRDEHGQLTFMSGAAAVSSIRGLPVYNTRSQETEAL